MSLRMARTWSSFGHSDCNAVNTYIPSSLCSLVLSQEFQDQCILPSFAESEQHDLASLLFFFEAEIYHDTDMHLLADWTDRNKNGRIEC